MNRLKNIIMIILIIIFTISVIPKTFQNDTFFTIALGERTLQYGIENEDKLVWHEGLNFIHLRWAFDATIAFLYNMYDFLGIYIFTLIIGSIISLLYYSILKYFLKNDILAFIFSIINIYFFSVPFVTARGQLISYVLFLLEYGCIEKYLDTNKKRYFFFLLIIPVLLVNFHASVFPVYFIIYMPYIAEFILAQIGVVSKEDSKIIIEKRKIKKLVLAMILSTFLGLCSPIGINSYTYMFKVMKGETTDFILEVQPIEIISITYFAIMIITTIAVIAFTKIKVKVTDCFFILGFAIMALTTYRCLSFFYLISTICIFKMVYEVIKVYDIKCNLKNAKLKVTLEILGCLCILFSSAKFMSSKISDKYVDTREYPVDISNYMIENVDLENMRLYNGLNYGSYLEFRGIPAFIDSRTELYTPEFNKECNILNDWRNVSKGKIDYKEIFEEYNITHALVYNSEPVGVYITSDKEWKRLYRDEIFSLYEKIDK